MTKAYTWQRKGVGRALRQETFSLYQDRFGDT